MEKSDSVLCMSLRDMKNSIISFELTQSLSLFCHHLSTDISKAQSLHFQGIVLYVMYNSCLALKRETFLQTHIRHHEINFQK